MKNIFYFNHINKIGGIETFFYQLAQLYNEENDIQNIIVMASDERYKIEGTKLIPQSIREYENERQVIYARI